MTRPSLHDIFVRIAGPEDGGGRPCVRSVARPPRILGDRPHQGVRHRRHHDADPDGLEDRRTSILRRFEDKSDESSRSSIARRAKVYRDSGNRHRAAEHEGDFQKTGERNSPRLRLEKVEPPSGDTAAVNEQRHRAFRPRAAGELTGVLEVGPEAFKRRTRPQIAPRHFRRRRKTPRKWTGPAIPKADPTIKRK